MSEAEWWAETIEVLFSQRAYTSFYSGEVYNYAPEIRQGQRLRPEQSAHNRGARAFDCSAGAEVWVCDTYGVTYLSGSIYAERRRYSNAIICETGRPGNRVWMAMAPEGELSPEEDELWARALRRQFHDEPLSILAPDLG